MVPRDLAVVDNSKLTFVTIANNDEIESSMGDTLKLVNQANISDRYFTTTDSNCAVYNNVSLESIGETASGTLTVQGCVGSEQ